MVIKRIFKRTYQGIRRIKYRLLSDNDRIEGNPTILQPVQCIGLGDIIFGDRVTLGYYPSPFFYNGVIYLEARRCGSKIKFGNNVFSNNNLTIICDKTSIEIGDNVLIGTNVEIIDSDFHEIHPARRNSGNHKCKPVVIENNVFIGSNVRILKGVTVGRNSIIANGAIVFSSIPENVIAAGNPAVVVKVISI